MHTVVIVRPQTSVLVKADSDGDIDCERDVQASTTFCLKRPDQLTRRRQLCRSMLRSDVKLEIGVIERVVFSLPELREHPEPGYSISVCEMADTFANVILACPWSSRESGSYHPHRDGTPLGDDVAATVKAALHAREEARRRVYTGPKTKAKRRAVARGDKYRRVRPPPTVCCRVGGKKIKRRSDRSDRKASTSTPR